MTNKKHLLILLTLAITLALTSTQTVAAKNEIEKIEIPFVVKAKGGNGNPPSSDPSIGLMNVAWDHTTITVLIISKTESWFKASYTSDVKNAINQWTTSISHFTTSYGSHKYDYINELTFKIWVYGFNTSKTSGYDVTIKFVEQQGSTLGVATIYYYVITRAIAYVKITLSCSYSDTPFSDSDMQNVACHEFGHVFALGHAKQATTSNGPELMYPYYPYAIGGTSTPIIYPSTLDIYGITVTHAWLKTGVFKAPTAKSASLPSGIPYEQIK